MAADKIVRTPSTDSRVGLAVKVPPKGYHAKRKYPLWQTVAGWMVHFYTGLGLPINFYAVRCLFVEHDFRMFLFMNIVAVFVDATDGTLARAVDIKNCIPTFDGSLLDNVVDFLTFSFMPSIAISAAEILPTGELELLCAFLCLFASGYQFCQSTAKTPDSFIGFPSYWNLLLWYMVILKPSTAVVVTSYVVCCVLSFVPIHFIYPSRCKKLAYLTVPLGIIWALMLASPLYYWDGKGPLQLGKDLVFYSLFYPVYYTAASLYLWAKGDI